MTGSTPNRNYPFPTPDSPNKPRVDIEALALSVDADVQDVADNGLPLGGNEGDHIVLQDDGKGGLEPIWEPHKDSGEGTVDWHEIGRGEFLMSTNFVSGPQVNRPTDVGKVAGHGAINATTGPMPVYHLAETDDGAGGTKLFDLSGDEFIMEESGATDYRATATIGGNEYPVALNSSSLRVTDPDGMNVEHVPSWTFTAFGITGSAPEQVELVVEAFGEISALPDDLVHQADLVGLASEAYVDSAIDAIPEVETPEIPSIEGLATVEYSDEMDAQVLATAKRYSDSVVAIEAGDNEIAQTYLQNPDVEGYKMTYWHSNATNPGGEIHASNIKNANGGFAYVRAKANENWGWLCIHEDYLGKSVDLDLHGLKSFWFKDWGNERFYVSKYGQTAPTPPEGAAWHSSGVSVSAGSLGASAVNIPFDGPESLDNMCNGDGREFNTFASGDKAASYGWMSLQEAAKEFKRGFIRSDENGHARIIEDPQSLMFMCYVRCSSSLSQAKMHSVINRNRGPLSIYKENPLAVNKNAPGDDTESYEAQTKLIERLEERVEALEKRLKKA